MSDKFWSEYDKMDKKSPDFGSWRSIPAGSIGTGQIVRAALLAHPQP